MWRTWELMLRCDNISLSASLAAGTNWKSPGRTGNVSLGKSKVDQPGKGWNACFVCCCKQVAPLKLKRALCPLHCLKENQFDFWKKVDTRHLRVMWDKCLELVGIDNPKVNATRRLWGLYSVRIGGTQSAAGKLNVGTLKKLGRWKDEKTELHYMGQATINNDQPLSIKWPLREI